jgi:hypothetical protein
MQREGVSREMKLRKHHEKPAVLVLLGRDPYCAPTFGETEMPTGMVQSDKGIWVYSALRRRQGRVCPHLSR